MSYNERYIKANNSEEAVNIAETLSVYAQPILISLYFLRFMICIVSLKHRRMTRLCFYLQFMIQMTEFLMPIDVSTAQFFLTAKIQAFQIDFAMTYFSFWPSVVCTTLAVASFHLQIYIFHDESGATLAGLFAINITCLLLTLLAIHLLVK